MYAIATLQFGEDEAELWHARSNNREKLVACFMREQRDFGALAADGLPYTEDFAGFAHFAEDMNAQDDCKIFFVKVA